MDRVGERGDGLLRHEERLASELLQNVAVGPRDVRLNAIIEVAVAARLLDMEPVSFPSPPKLGLSLVEASVILVRARAVGAQTNLEIPSASGAAVVESDDGREGEEEQHALH